MRAVVFSEWQTFPSIENIEQPEPRAGEVLLKVAGAGACHSDVAIYRDFAKDAPGSIPPPFTLGHENAGWVDQRRPVEEVERYVRSTCIQRDPPGMS